MIRTVKTTIVAVAALSAVSLAAASPISGYITADNHYAFYTGTLAGSSMDFHGANERGVRGAPGRYNWSLPEHYDFTTDDDYLYIAAWSDDRVAQGLLADLDLNGRELLSGDNAWEVFMTNHNLNDGAPAPTVGQIAAQVAAANSIGGWRPIAVGGRNGVAPWHTIPDISHDARWMWAPSPTGNRGSFRPGSGAGEYLIFRAPTVPEPSTILIIVGGAAIVMRRRKAAAPRAT